MIVKLFERYNLYYEKRVELPKSARGSGFVSGQLALYTLPSTSLEAGRVDRKLFFVSYKPVSLGLSVLASTGVLL